MMMIVVAYQAVWTMIRWNQEPLPPPIAVVSSQIAKAGRYQCEQTTC
jgi:hypothetical protein